MDFRLAIDIGDARLFTQYARRTGAIGAVAAEALASPTATDAAIIGTGTQALTRLWALSTIRDLSQVWVFFRDPARREAFAQLAQCLYGVVCHAAPTARDAVDGAQIVVLATNSPTPVIDAGLLEPDASVTTLGPKQQGLSEFGRDLPAAAALGPRIPAIGSWSSPCRCHPQ